jgi:hypothetical protein
MGINVKAQQDEIKAFKSVQKQLGNPEAFASPAGFATGFPDFGFTVYVNKKRVDLFFEYKADYKAQMGSMRNWTFDGRTFDAPDSATDEDKQQLLEIMNNTPDAIKNGKRLLKDFKDYFDNPKKPVYRIPKISSGMLSVEKDIKLRKTKLQNFANNTENYQVANIDNSTMGQKILDHYHKKFIKNLNRQADHSILFMMLDDTIWFIEETGNLTRDEKMKVAKMLGADSITHMNNPKAKLEVRIQPRGLSGGDKAPSIDVMASFRLSAKPSGGVKI